MVHFDEFDHVSKSEWFERIRKDLKGRALEDLAWKPYPDLDVLPFIHADDLETPVQVTRTENGNTWQIGEEIPCADPLIANRMLLEALKGGCNAPVLHFRHRIEKSDPGIIFKGVVPEAIHPVFRFPDFPDRTTLDALAGACREDLVIRHPEVQLPLDTKGTDEILFNLLKTWPDFRLCILPLSQRGEALIDPIADAIVRAIGWLEHGPKDQILRQLTFQTRVSRQFYIEVARLRAVKILWHNIIVALHPESDPGIFIEVRIEPEPDEADTYMHMISNSTRLVSAVLGGADRITILPMEEADDRRGFSRRIARNIHHLAMEEAHFDQYRDAIAGSYYFDVLTKQIVEGAWEKIIQKVT